MYTVKAFRVSGLFCHLPAGQSVISASNVFTDSHVISGPALEVVAELGHRAFLPCSLSSPQVLSIKFLNLKTVSQVIASNPIPPPHFKGFQRMNQETYIQNIVRHKHHNFYPAWRSSTTRALVQRGEAGKANLHGRPQRCNSSTNNPGSNRTYKSFQHMQIGRCQTQDIGRTKLPCRDEGFSRWTKALEFWWLRV